MIYTKRVIYTALELFNYFSKTICTKKIDQTEGQIIQKSPIGTIIFYKPNCGPAYEYDIIVKMLQIILISFLICISFNI